MIIKKKTWTEAFEKVLSGEKTFEFRLADWECKPGNVLILEEYDPKTKKYSGRKIEKIVTYVSKTKDQKYFSKEDVEKYGFQVIAFK